MKELQFEKAVDRLDGRYMQGSLTQEQYAELYKELVEQYFPEELPAKLAQQ
jgi:hypothetical protein